MKRFIKDPDAVLDYTVDWARWLDGDDTITSLTVTVDDAEGGVTVDSEEHTDTTATAWISGGTIGVTYHVAFRVDTAGGRTDERTIALTVRER